MGLGITVYPEDGADAAQLQRFQPSRPYRDGEKKRRHRILPGGGAVLTRFRFRRSSYCPWRAATGTRRRRAVGIRGRRGRWRCGRGRSSLLGGRLPGSRPIGGRLRGGCQDRRVIPLAAVDGAFPPFIVGHADTDRATAGLIVFVGGGEADLVNPSIIKARTFRPPRIPTERRREGDGAARLGFVAGVVDGGVAGADHRFLEAGFLEADRLEADFVEDVRIVESYHWPLSTALSPRLSWGTPTLTEPLQD